MIVRSILSGALVGALIAVTVCRFIERDLRDSVRAGLPKCDPNVRCILQVYGDLPPGTSMVCRAEWPVIR